MLVVHHTFLGEMTSKLTTRLLQRISLVRSNREGWIGDYGAGLVGVKIHTDEATQYEGHRSLPPVTPGLQKDINRAIIYVPGSSHTYIQQNE